MGEDDYLLSEYNSGFLNHTPRHHEPASMGPIWGLVVTAVFSFLVVSTVLVGLFGRPL